MSSCPSLTGEIRDDVVRIARNRDDGVTVEQIAADFGVHPMTMTKWTRQPTSATAPKPGTSTADPASSSRRTRCYVGRWRLVAVQSTGRKTGRPRHKCVRMIQRGDRAYLIALRLIHSLIADRHWGFETRVGVV
jgi:transposase-like protein